MRDQDPATTVITTRAIDPNRAAILAVHDALQGLLPVLWSAEPFEGCDGDWSLVIMIPCHEPPATYVVSASPAGLKLAELRDDELRALRDRLGLDALISLLIKRIAGDHDTIARAA